jgi:phytoene synthase
VRAPGGTHRAQTAPSRAADQGHVARVTRRSGSNFACAFLFLPRPQRDAIRALYAFCREVDDSVDAAPDAPEASRRVETWRAELAACYAGQPGHPITRSLARHLRAYPIRREDLEDIVDGVSMDIGPRRYATFDELRVYCHRVASAVGLACLEIFGYTQPSARAYATTLGLAFQMTNILRDVGPDAARGRIYIPQEDLHACGCPEEDLRAPRPTAAFLRLMRLECERARSLFGQAAAQLPPADRRSLVAAEIMRAIYETILRKIEARGHDVLSGRVALSSARRLAIASRVYLRTLGAARA